MSGISGYGAYINYGAMYNGSANVSIGNAGAASVSGATETGKISDSQLRTMKRQGQIQCETCASRKYKDGSDEGDVSFKAPGHISPGSAAGRVMAHEQEHVANAYEKAGNKGGTVINATVSLKTAICPECGRAYVAGGVTNSTIKYPKDQYGQNRKSADYEAMSGKKINYAV